MFYVSSLKDNKIGITDTRDNKEEFYSNKEIVQFVESKVADIYGVSVFNHEADCTVLQTDKSLSSSKLKELLTNWKNLHNPWTGVKVQDYLAEAKVGTIIDVDYITTDSSGRPHRGNTVIKKLDYDNWKYEDTNNTASGDIGNSRFAAWTLEVACIYSKCQRLSIK